MPISEQPAGGKRIAVTEFVNRTDFGDTEFAEKARDAFESELASTNRFTIVERSRLNLIMKEQAFSQSGLVDEQTMSRLGKLASANYICTGAIEGMSAEERGSEKLRQKALSIFGINRSNDFFGLTKGNDPYQTAWDLSLTIRIRIIDVEKGTLALNRTMKVETPNIRLRKSTKGPVYDTVAAFDILKPVMEEVASQVARFFPK
jgi:curli biogenesis system outer membrane secretion channel CsgG